MDIRDPLPAPPTTTATAAAVLARPSVNPVAPPHRRRRILPGHVVAITVAGVAVTDLSTKAAVATLVPVGHQVGPLLPVSNPRFMLGVAGADPLVMVALMVLGVAVAAVIATRLVHGGRISALAAGLALGGGVANTLDRAVHGAVQDFLTIGQVVVNLADLAVLAGFALAIGGAARARHRDHASR